MSETTPRQVLYALVSVGFLLMVVVLAAGGAISGLTPTWWSVVLGLLVLIGGGWMVFNWKRTGPVLLIAIALFLIWMIGTLVVAGG
ncbi:MAG: LPXTG cell wall anchor domain-containing protein [Acidimicrobiia bacterium]